MTSCCTPRHDKDFVYKYEAGTKINLSSVDKNGSLSGMAETEDANTKRAQSVPSIPTERKTILSEDDSQKIGIEEDRSHVIERLRQVFKLSPNASSSSSIVDEIQQILRKKEDLIKELSQTAKDHTKLVDAIRGIAPCPHGSSVDTVIYQLRISWRRQEATRIVMKKKLDKIKEKLSSISNATCELEHQCHLVSENESLRKQYEEMKKRFEELIKEHKRFKECTSGQPQIMLEEGEKAGTKSAADLTVANRPDGETKGGGKTAKKIGSGTHNIGNQNTSAPEKNSDELSRKTKEELTCLHFENDNNKDMVDRLRKMLSTFHQNLIITSGTLQVSPLSKIDQAVLATFSKVPVKRLDPASLQLWRNKSTGTAEEILIGKGAFGKVKLMHYLPTNIPVAVKVQEKKNRGISEDEMKNKLISRSMKEAVMHHVMSDNPSFPALLGVVEEEDNNLGVVLEFVGDKRFTIIHPLCDVLFQRRPGLSRLEWIDIALDIIQGLVSLHDKGLLHNDLKKNNILLQRSGERWRAYIIDFGHGSTITMPLKFPTFTLEEEREYLEGLLYHHLAPEIVKDKQPTSVYSDIYSLGKILYDIGIVSGDGDVRITGDMCTRDKPYRRPTMSNIEIAIMRSKQKAQQ